MEYKNQILDIRQNCILMTLRLQKGKKPLNLCIPLVNIPHGLYYSRG